MFVFVALLFSLNYRANVTEASSESGDTNDSQMRYKAEWSVWKRAFGKRYNRGNEMYRYKIWESNLHHVTNHNLRAVNGKESYLQGMTILSAHETQELDELLLAQVPIASFYQGEILVKVKEREEVPSDLNWAWRGWVSDVKDLTFYPSGWACSVTGAIEAQLYNASSSGPVNLSVREIIDCVHRYRSREPISVDAFRYILHKGVILHSYYPAGRRLQRMPCMTKAHHPRFTISNYGLLQPGNEDNLKTALALIGPISVSIKVTKSFFFYTSGVLYDALCQVGDASRPTVINHAVLLVGYATSEKEGAYWIIQNNWGSQWGEEGFAKLPRKSLFNCGIASAPFYPTLS